MHLEDQIVLLTNPQEFTRLCNCIFYCIYNDDYQIIDGTRSDEGNDGYVSTEKRILAIYCPIKPEKKTDKNYLAKIASDIKKAATLRDTGKYKVERWTFVTPRKLSSSLVAEMYKLGSDLGLTVNHIESTYLANELYKNMQLLEAFPQLHVAQIEKKLEEIFQHVKQGQSQEENIPRNPAGSPYIEVKDADSKDNKRVLELRLNVPSDTTKKDLRTLYYKAKDNAVQLNALIGLIDLFDPLEDPPSEMIELCKFGIKIAESMNSSRFKAYFIAQKAYFVSCDFTNTDMKMFFDIRASNLVGIPFVTEPQRQETLGRLRHLQEEYNSLFDEALSLLVKSNDAEMMGGVLIIIGNAAGQRALIYRQLGITERYKYEKTLSKNSLLLAKNIYVKIGDEEGIALSLHNLANQLRFFDEKDEALALVEESKEVARKLGNKIFLQKAIWLEETINTGKIPDYIHGEKRKPSV